MEVRSAGCFGGDCGFRTKASDQKLAYASLNITSQVSSVLLADGEPPTRKRGTRITQLDTLIGATDTKAGCEKENVEATWK